MIKDLVRDQDILTKKCERATAADADMAQDLLDTMASIEECGCLAANQIGVTKAVIAYVDEKGEPRVMYNPRIMMGLGAIKVVEGCLTYDKESNVTRYTKVKVAYDRLVDGEFKAKRADLTGWVAEMVQHMIDHCNGKLI